jgi:ABC-type dipeptide/oligopeptide/nickel transport system permease component
MASSNESITAKAENTYY